MLCIATCLSCNSKEKTDLKELINTNYVENLGAKNVNVEKESKDFTSGI